MTRALITGAGSGIGRLIALGLATRGTEIVIWDINDTSALVNEINASGGVAIAARIDISDTKAVERAAAETPEIDIVVNNAGVVTGKRFLDLDPDDVERTFKINVLSLYAVTGAFLPGMIERGHGMVVTISSAAGLVGVAKQTDYSASKFAAFGFMESLRAEMKQQRTGVSTLTVCPYYISTGMFDGVTTKFPRLLPILKPTEAADKILAAIEGDKEQLVMPPLVATLPVMRLLPVRVFDKLMNFFGVNSTMDNFTGRKETGKHAPTIGGNAS